MATQQYPWKNPSDSQIYHKIARIKYFKPWDWVIGVSLPQEEMYGWRRKSTGFRIAPRLSSCLWAPLPGAHLRHLADAGPIVMTRQTDKIIRALSQASKVVSSAAGEASTTSRHLAQESPRTGGLQWESYLFAPIDGRGGPAESGLCQCVEVVGGRSPQRRRRRALQMHAMTETMSQISVGGRRRGEDQ